MTGLETWIAFMLVVTAVVLVVYSIQEAASRKRQTERGERPPRAD